MPYLYNVRQREHLYLAFGKLNKYLDKTLSALASGIFQFPEKELLLTKKTVRVTIEKLERLEYLLSWSTYTGPGKDQGAGKP